MGDGLAQWVVRSPAGRSPGDHLCWPFRGRRDLARAVEGFVAEGLAMHERVVYVAEGRTGDLHDDLAGVAGVAGYLERGQLQLVAIETVPASAPGVDARCELRVLGSMVQESLAAGYVGMRMFVDATVWAADTRRRARQVGLEHQLDRFCLTEAVTVLCAYDVARVGDGAVAELACVHPLTGEELSPFHVRAARTADAALAGSVDVLCAAQLELTLARIALAPSRGQAVVDASDLAFIDIRGLLALERHAAGNGATVVLRSPPSVVPRLLELVDLRAVRVQDAR